MNKGLSPLINLLAWSITAVALLLWGFLTPTYNDSVQIDKRLGGDKTVTLTVKFASVEYEYKNLTTSSGTVYDLLGEYDEVTDLDFDGNDTDKKITALKGTSIGSGIFVVKINGEYGNLLGGESISDGDEIVIEYTKVGTLGSEPLVDGGVKNERRTPIIVVGFVALGFAIITGVRILIRKKRAK